MDAKAWLEMAVAGLRRARRKRIGLYGALGASFGIMGAKYGREGGMLGAKFGYLGGRPKRANATP